MYCQRAQTMKNKSKKVGKQFKILLFIICRIFLLMRCYKLFLWVYSSYLNRCKCCCSVDIMYSNIVKRTYDANTQNYTHHEEKKPELGHKLLLEVYTYNCFLFSVTLQVNVLESMSVGTIYVYAVASSGIYIFFLLFSISFI